MKRDAFTAAPIRYLSLFSGIEAASVAWAPLGWVCVGVAEIDKFPCAVLAHHYPNVPNLGDITKITEADIAALGRIDAMVFGSPCQDMSVAGKRKGLLNADGTVTRSGLFFAAFNIFQWARKHGGARFAVWENVPGAYSSNQGRDFASVVEFMAGLDDVAVPAHGWGAEGCALGDNGLLEWACLDAQWFGVAQRRRRVFAVLDTGNWASRPPILLERESLRGDFAPRRETGQDAAAATLRSSDGGSDVDHAVGGHLQPVVLPGARAGGAELGIDRSPTLTCNHEAPIVAGALGSSSPQAQAIAFDTYNQTVTGDVTQTLCSRGDSPGGVSHLVPAIAFSCKDHGADATIELAPTMRAMNSVHSNQNAGGQLAVCVTGDVTHCLKAEGFDASEDGTGRGQPIVTAFKSGQSEAAGGIFMTEEFAPTLQAQNNGSTAVPAIQYGMAVRRLTPIECSRLQGFPDQYLGSTIYRGKPPADGPMYKALGNSFAVPVVAWIGRQIQRAAEAA